VKEVIVSTRYGAVRGYEVDDLKVWKGVPYAEAPVGPLRFGAPKPPKPWTGVRDATQYGPVAMQSPTPGMFGGPPYLNQSEDCLTLNIWAPAGADGPRPVMVWIHGGAFVSGSGSAPWYDGASLARDGPIVVVTFNYRLGPFGFLFLEDIGGPAYRGSGNVGILDQLWALKWIHDNISQFGGDPEQVTVVGESAGSMSVGTLMTMPAAQGLFHRAIMESGVPLFRTRAAASAVTQEVIQRLGLRNPRIADLAALPDQDLLAAALEVTGDAVLPWAPMVDGLSIVENFWLAQDRAWSANVPLLIGSNRDELWLWAAMNPAWQLLSDHEMLATFEAQWGPLRSAVRDFYLSGKTGPQLFDALMELGTHYAFWYPTVRLASIHSMRAPTWVYRFDWRSTANNGLLRACHALEIPFVFNTLDAAGVVQVTGDDPRRYQVAQHMHQAWLQFIMRGDPNIPELPRWPRYDVHDRPVMTINLESRLEWDPDGTARQLWDAVIAHPDEE
jgi:para-nitrobenzyl esterase